MCGPSDLDALQSCMSRLILLSSTGVSAYAAFKAAALVHRVRIRKSRAARRSGKKDSVEGVRTERTCAACR
jgi:hypothetical protein